jgi:DNA segregation ATPase FtsK/SpoIIIE-like protein
MTKNQLKNLKAILRSIELNNISFSEIQLALEKEQFILEDRQFAYENRDTDYGYDKADDLDERIAGLTEDIEALQDIEEPFSNLINLMRDKISKIETRQFNSEIQPIIRETDKIQRQIKTIRDPLFNEVARLVVKSNTTSTASLQRRYSIGYNRAGKIMDQLEAAGIVGPIHGASPRSVLVDSATLEDILRKD